jgi:hypothetical protein
MQTQRLGKTATTVQTRDGQTEVQYHDTVVVAFDEVSVTLDSGGWRTASTKGRMNQAANQFDLGFQVYQERGEWYVVMRVDGSYDWDSPATFEDGMVFPRGN